MKFKIKKTNLARVMNLMAGIIAEDRTTDINNSLLLVGEGAVITFAGNSSLGSLSTRAPGEFKEPFRCCLQYKQLAQVVKSLSDEVEVTVREGWANVISGTTRFRVPSANPMNFPEIKQKCADGARITSEILVKVIQTASVAAAKADYGQYAFRCVDLSVRGDSMKVQCCDGKEVVIITVKVSNPGGGDLSLLFPYKSVATITKFCDEVGEVQVGITGNYAQFSVGTDVLNLILGTGTMPDLTQVVPKTSDYTARFVRSDLIDAFRRAETFSKERYVTVNFSPNKVTLGARNRDYGEAETDLACVTTDLTEPLALTLISTQVLGIISQLRTEEVTVHFSKLTQVKSKPTQVKITPVGEEDFDLTYVTMPVRAVEDKEVNSGTDQ